MPTLPHIVLAVLFIPLLLIGCDSGPTQPDVPTIEETDFAPSLNVDLSAMTETSSGLYYRDWEEGTGTEATAGDFVQVRYSGYLSNGTQFDSNVDHEEPFTFQLDRGRVIEGFDEGLTGMQVEGERQIIIPPSLGYGAQPVGSIPPNSILVFEIELVGVDESQD